MVSDGCHLLNVWPSSASNSHGQRWGDHPLLGLLGPPITPWPSPMGHPIPYEPSPTGPAHTPWLPFLSPPIAPWPSPMGHPVPDKPPSTGPAHTTLLPSLGPPITPWPSPIGQPLLFQSIGPPITSHYISVLHILYCYILSYLTLGQPIHYRQLHSWAHP
ncbi:hypothetical protein PAXRUDRAFT_792306 [Paxillus rubicundulus Ve08.2h10]|uniref:Uncharacterized protein n=1 Tax=Paxillus rubicundulus Ve08.2h10 TaxID=930991 RepID=A0A0D0DM31_9AGAM|nr:hypothetical protein PAXRUDRAFT_792306 [Paxillus rubicundulus Ve08.2h10]